MRPYFKKIGFILAILALVAVALGLRLYRFTPPPTLLDYTLDSVSQLPPGLHSDEAYNALGGWRLLHGTPWTPYSDIDQGRSVAHMTLTAMIIALAGPLAESARLASLIAGLISIIGMAVLVTALFQTRLPRSTRRLLAGIAAWEVAATYWFVHFSRAGFELITLPMLMLLAFAALWWWLHQPTLSKAVLAGALLGLTLYSYYAAYAVPVLVALFIGIYLLTQHDRPAWRQLIVYALAFGISALPLSLYALEKSDLFFHRISDTAASSATDVVTRGAATLLGLVAQGDTTAAYNLPGRALLDPLQAGLCLIGLITCVRRGKQPEFLFVVLWLVIMLLPAQLSNSAPAFNRLAGAVPALLLLVALGGLQVYGWLARLPWKWMAPVTLIGLLAFTTFKTAYDYFEVWPHSKGLLTTFSVAERLQAEAIKSLAATQQVFLSPSDRQRSIFSYLWQDQTLAKSFNGRRCTIIPRQTSQDTDWILNVLEDKHTVERLAAFYPSLVSRPLWIEAGTSVIRQLSVKAGVSAQIPTTTLATIGDLFRLRDYQLINPPARGDNLRIRLLWEPIGPTSEDWTIATFLVDAAGQVRAQEDRQPCDDSYSTSRWQPTELVSDDRVVAIPDDFLAGEYQLKIAIYRLSDNTRLPVRGSANQLLGDMLTLGTIVVQ